MNSNFKLLDGIVAFVEVVKNGSFTNAAEKSGHSTSFISKEISKLETRLGVRLLNRTTRSLGLTPEGEAYYKQCQQIVEDANSAELLLSGQQQEPQGVLKVSCPVNFGLSKLRPIVAQFIAQYPKVKLDLDLSDRKVDIVADGFDVVVRASGKLEDSSLISRRLIKSEGVTIASPSYLKKHGTPSHPNDLPQYKTFSYSNLKHPNVWNFFDLEGQPFQVTVDSQVITNSSEMEVALCVAGEGITRMPKFNVERELADGRLVEIFAEYPKTEVSIYLVYPSRKHMSSKVRCFIDFVVAELSN